MFICGSGSFGNQDEDHQENESNGSPCPTPKRSKRSTSFCKIICKDTTNKNPYADRGLDKFYALLADLDTKKQKIYTQKGSEEISFVRFVYANDSDQVKPIVVKIKDKNNHEDKKFSSTKSLPKQQPQPVNSNNNNNITKSAATISSAEVTKEESKESKENIPPPKKKRCLRSCSAASFKLENMRHPFFYFPVILVLILLFLAVYGRSFAILCTSIGWYMLPSIVGGGFSSFPVSERKPKRKKEYVRRQSDKKIVVHREEPTSPKSVINGP
ncbi:hypothetical protein MIMGU_mgv1a026636mg [Erythranthe guttata]|uniref:ZCF37 n=1 Tax=Erythranthe guttata TaxID=4155 RepID=A0A022QA19_ERYGU|nr:PREDICTED: uncharacterized protein LOC105971311 [Erythranthe guttata]EYU25517.1 hypothetical protein MIMGU_mgv1a026636mg [Erythranthe guttata]|eukprot:XP_012851613.1 PREDICTED: uncharacterized protein LOC105971311 [Erythranthe guttata]